GGGGWERCRPTRLPHVPGALHAGHSGRHGQGPAGAGAALQPGPHGRGAGQRLRRPHPNRARAQQ
ncbi:unnamed protein product, partial [Heterosigma akashiwo]